MKKEDYYKDTLCAEIDPDSGFFCTKEIGHTDNHFAGTVGEKPGTGYCFSEWPNVIEKLVCKHCGVEIAPCGDDCKYKYECTAHTGDKHSPKKGYGHLFNSSGGPCSPGDNHSSGYGYYHMAEPESGPLVKVKETCTKSKSANITIKVHNTPKNEADSVMVELSWDAAKALKTILGHIGCTNNTFVNGKYVSPPLENICSKIYGEFGFVKEAPNPFDNGASFKKGYEF